MGWRTAVILGNNFDDLEPVPPLCQLLCGRSEGSRYVDPNRNHLNTIRRHIGIYRSVIHTVVPGDILWVALCPCVQWIREY